jgi:vancomycin resistance protein VanJ
MAKSKGRRDIILPCSGAGHRVRLGKGRRFWFSAKCPRCQSPVDPRRTERVLGFFKNLKQPAGNGLSERGIWWGTAAFAASALLAFLLVWGLGDRWWPATVLLFGPRWVLLLPLFALLPFAFLRDRALLVPLGLAGALILGPVLGLETGLRSVLSGGASGPTIRVVSFNARGGEMLLPSPANHQGDWQADIVAFQECGGSFAGTLREIPGWHFDARSGLCLLSRFEILEIMEMERESLEFAGGAGVVTTYRLGPDEAPIYVTNLHLETPRAGFELIRSGRLVKGIEKVKEKSMLREIELRRAGAWADFFDGPHIVLGDFNTPPESRAYREAWGEWQNTFSMAGKGFGGTRLNGWIRVRIDHILGSEDWTVIDAWLEKDVGSDHLPIAAEVRER